MRCQIKFMVILLIALFSLSTSNAVADGAVIYVNAAAPGGNGSSWRLAYNDLQLALANADAGDEVWVATGTYRPAGAGGDRAVSFQLKSGVAIYGGFDGSESNLRERDPVANVTILSGDLNQDDVGGPDDPSKNDNSWHVVVAYSVDSTAILDGFIVAAGHADGPHEDSIRGGGIRIVTASPILRQCVFDSNICRHAGGAAYIATSQPIFEHCRFLRNAALGNAPSQGFGGAIVSVSGSTLTATDCEFTGNSGGNIDGSISAYGGAVYGYIGIMSFTRCAFTDNTSGGDGAGVWAFDCPVVIDHCTFKHNAAWYGGGAIVLFTDVTALNCTFIGNTAGAVGGAAAVEKGTGQWTNCGFFGNHASSGGGFDSGNMAISTLTNCAFSGNVAVARGGAVWSTTDPDPNGRTNLINCSITNNHAGEGGGVFIDGYYGVENTIRSTIFWGNTDDSGSGESAQIKKYDQYTFIALNWSDVQGLTGALGGTGNINADPMFVDTDGTDNVIGTEDDDLHLQAGSPCINRGQPSAPPPYPTDLYGDIRIQQCRIDIGVDETSFFDDCNSNGLSDACEIQAGAVADCNANWIPDSCDIAGGMADVDHNGVPDVCQCYPDIVAPFGQVNIDDLVFVITHWGVVDSPGDDLADLAPYPPGGNGVVDIDDLVAVITHWGACPP